MIKKFRRRAYTVHAVQWLGEENCEEVFAFLGLDHPEDELNHDAIHFDNPNGGTDTVFPGEWVVANDRGAGHRAYQDRWFRAAFEPEADDVDAPPADRAAVLREAADGFDRHAEQILDGVESKAVFVAKALRDQAAVWREAAETLRRLADERDAADAYDRVLRTPPSAEACAALRERLASGQVARRRVRSRLAAETPQPETQAEAHEPEHTWAAELHDPLADEWVPGTRYVDRERAVNALVHARRLGPTWKDGTPTLRRLVRATTTYTVEPDTAPAVVQADGEA